MKKNTLVLLAGLLLAGNYSLKAQNWVNGGNTLSADGRLGTNSSHSLIFETGNEERGRVNTAGLWGLGTTTPNSRLHINGPTTLDPLRVQVNGTTRFFVNRNGGVSVGAADTPPTNGLYVAGSLGIGIAAPTTRFHVNRNDGFFRLGLFSNASTTGDRTALIEIRNGDNVTWRYGVGGTGNGLGLAAGQFYVERVGLATPTFSISQAGKVGIGIGDPDRYMLKVKQTEAYGINLEHPAGNNWEQWVSVSGNLLLYHNGFSRGAFNSVTGAYLATSDARLKTDIQPMSSMLSKINELKPATYHFKTNGSEAAKTDVPLEYGFLAQDVEKVFPSLVTHQVEQERGLDTYMLNYSGFGAIAIKGIQELQEVITEQREKINTLEQRLAALEAAVTAQKSFTLDMPDGKVITVQPLPGVVLEQNHPNKFDQLTTVRYQIPPSAKAELRVYDWTGTLVKTLSAPASGQVTISAADLPAGTYVYTLVVNGTTAASKKMIVIK